MLDQKLKQKGAFHINKLPLEYALQTGIDVDVVTCKIIFLCSIKAFTKYTKYAMLYRYMILAM